MQRKGFTLVELLAVIVVLAIILAIAVPAVIGIVHDSTMNAMESDAKLLLKSIDLKKLEDNSFDPTSYNDNTSDLFSILKLSNENYASTSFVSHRGKLYVKIVGQNKWDGLSACGTYQSMAISEGDCKLDLPDPSITLNGSTEVCAPLNGSFTDPGATALSIDDIDITSKITKSYTKGGSSVPNVDLTSAGTYTITYQVEDNGSIVSTNRNVVVFNSAINFASTGVEQSYTVMCPGTYMLEVWGAEGGDYNTNNSTYPAIPGKGGYSKGNVYLPKDTKLYIYVGKQGQNGGTNIFNGGGNVTGSSCGSGGGGTDIRINGNTVYYRVIVAGGGGGTNMGASDHIGSGGAGGGTYGNNGALSDGGGGGTPNAGGIGGSYGGNIGGTGTFGAGGNGGRNASNGWGAGGGGGGWYGGGGGGTQYGGGGGGSGYVWTVSTASYAPTGYLVPTSFYLTNASTTGGNRTGDGQAKITYVSE